MKLLMDTAVNVSWETLIISDVAIDSYTVVYSQNASNNNKVMAAVFPGHVTSGVITDLEPSVIYNFQMFATVIVANVPLEGEWSEPVFKQSKKYSLHSN